MNNDAELLRLIENLIRLGTIAEVDHERARVRVKSRDLLTGWLPWADGRAGETRDWNPPTVGEQVLMFSPGGDTANGVAVTGLFQTAHPAPSADPAIVGRWYPDGAIIEYDHVNHRLSATLPGSADITAPGGATINADTVINGNTHVNGSFSASGGDFAHNGTDVGDSHKHGGIKSGPSTTGAPV